MQSNEQKEHKQGTPWKVVKKTTTYDAAASHRDEILASWKDKNISDMQVKIRRMNDPAGFTIRTRLDPKVAEEKKKVKKKPTKKKAKAKEPASKND